MADPVISGFGSPERLPDDSYHSGNTMKEVVPGTCKEALTSPQAELQPVIHPEESGKPGIAETQQLPWLPMESPCPPPHPVQPPLREGSKRKTVCGMSMATFTLAVALFVVIVGAAVGGGVGGSMAASTSRSLHECQSALSQQASSPLPAPTAAARDSNCTATNKMVLETGPNGGIVPPTRDVIVELDCPAMQGAQKFVSIGGKRLTFAVRCGKDFNRRDIGSAIAYSMDHCLHSCASLNVISGRQQCVAVTFAASLSESVGARDANCWLKNETATPDRGKGDGTATGRLLETVGT